MNSASFSRNFFPELEICSPNNVTEIVSKKQTQ